VPGSEHGYDVVSHHHLNEELGGAEGWRELVEACHRHRLGIVVDVVPNHMAVPVPEQLNSALWDVLTHGRESEHATWFDVDWEMHDGRLLMPVLGQDLAGAVAAGEVHVDTSTGLVRYFDHAFPLAPGTESLTGDTEALLAAQHYLLAHWRTAAEQLNYRRFFDVTSLIGVRVEQEHVFDATHQVLLDRVAAGDIDGLRIDHPDGLAEPRGYLDRLAKRSGGAWTVVEKILEPGERLPAGWRTAGTTGYDAIGEITHLLLDPAGEQPLTSLYTSLTGMPAGYGEVVETAKRHVVTTLFGSEVTRLMRDLQRVDAAAEPLALLGPEAVADAIRELLVAFDVYRAYAGDPPSDERIAHAMDVVRSRRPDLRDQVGWLVTLLRREVAGAHPFATRFEQTTGPVMAKGVEDTSFYRYLRLVALNEVGGDPGRFGASVDEWHRHCAVTAEQWPTTLTTLTTHDTKRSEDVRARLLVLAERPEQWAEAVRRWRELAAKHGQVDANTDYLLWQTLVGAWPITPQRLTDYLVKAGREAKQHTSWLDPDDDYEQRLAGYAENVLDDARITADVDRWVAETSAATRSNVLAQKLLQLSMPGVADVYQGQEVDDRSLVDPDNRRPVDYDDRCRRLAALADDPTGRVSSDDKLLVTTRVLHARRQHPASFLSGGYRPVPVTGPAADHAVSFARGDDVIAVATRLPSRLAARGGWGPTALDLPPGSWSDVLTGRPADADVAGVLGTLPVALLVRRVG
jgi:(1->4)-alpha-D-glucan 1-alpha-D-glucosylmutase